MLYEPNETKTSQKQPEQIFKSLKGPACLLGGWAVYHIVNKNFEKTNGKPYIGSRDIDIGFHIDKNWTEKAARSLVARLGLFVSKRALQSSAFILIHDIVSQWDDARIAVS